MWNEKGILSMPASEKQYVVDCVTGRMIKLEEARWIGFSKKYGGPFWIKNDLDLVDNDLQNLHHSKPKEGENV